MKRIIKPFLYSSFLAMGLGAFGHLAIADNIDDVRFLDPKSSVVSHIDEINDPMNSPFVKLRVENDHLTREEVLSRYAPQSLNYKDKNSLVYQEKDISNFLYFTDNTDFEDLNQGVLQEGFKSSVYEKDGTIRIVIESGSLDEALTHYSNGQFEEKPVEIIVKDGVTFSNNEGFNFKFDFKRIYFESIPFDGLDVYKSFINQYKMGAVYINTIENYRSLLNNEDDLNKIFDFFNFEASKSIFLNFDSTIFYNKLNGYASKHKIEMRLLPEMVHLKTQVDDVDNDMNTFHKYGGVNVIKDKDSGVVYISDGVLSNYMNRIINNDNLDNYARVYSVNFLDNMAMTSMNLSNLNNPYFSLRNVKGLQGDDLAYILNWQNLDGSGLGRLRSFLTSSNIYYVDLSFSNFNKVSEYYFFSNTSSTSNMKSVSSNIYYLGMSHLSQDVKSIDFQYMMDSLNVKENGILNFRNFPFEKASSYQELFKSNIVLNRGSQILMDDDFTINKKADVNGMFSGLEFYKGFDFFKTFNVYNWDIRGRTSLKGLFRALDSNAFYGMSEFKFPDWDLSTVEDYSNMFNVTGLDGVTFYSDKEFTNGNNFDQMFSTSQFSIINLENFNPKSNNSKISMKSMFNNMKPSFKTLLLPSFEGAVDNNIQYDFTNMFANSSSLNYLDIGDFSVNANANTLNMFFKSDSIDNLIVSSKFGPLGGNFFNSGFSNKLGGFGSWYNIDDINSKPISPKDLLTNGVESLEPIHLRFKNDYYSDIYSPEVYNPNDNEDTLEIDDDMFSNDYFGNYGSTSFGPKNFYMTWVSNFKTNDSILNYDSTHMIADGLERNNQSITSSSFLQIKDEREVENITPWKISIKAGPLKLNGSNDKIEGAKLIFNDLNIKESSNKLLPELNLNDKQFVVDLNDSDKVFASFNSNKAIGVWSQEFNDMSVSIPTDRFVKSGVYTSDIYWTLSVDPTSK